jgi:hypothetical protein
MLTTHPEYQETIGQRQEKPVLLNVHPLTVVENIQSDERPPLIPPRTHNVQAKKGQIKLVPVLATHLQSYTSSHLHSPHDRRPAPRVIKKVLQPKDPATKPIIELSEAKRAGE